MSGIATVMKKEFARFFGDKRMVLSTLLSAVLIYVVYSFMGTAMQDMFAPDVDHTPIVYAVNLEAPIEQRLQSAGLSVRQIGENEVDSVKERISQRDVDVVAVFPIGFVELATAFNPQTVGGLPPNVEVFFNSTDPNSSNTFMRVVGLLDEYEAYLSNRFSKFDINRIDADMPVSPDLATEADISATIISSLMPMLLMMFLFTGCMALAPESIAGEKERGTLATLLVTPLGRSELAAGKILSLAVLSFLSGLVTTVATILALPNLMGGGADGAIVDVGIYSTTDYIWLGVVILSTILLSVAVISIISAFAKSVKEANMAISPLMVIVMVVGVTGMFGGIAENPMLYLIPFYSSVQSMSGILALDYYTTNVAISSISNIVYACIGGIALTKMFNSEKVMFSK
ncbi:MAG: ABC transporter permease subunit [Oscillospiraceae bacterium]|nr:ABC transporter permease subunit [Oscillospiraceae bacterium]